MANAFREVEEAAVKNGEKTIVPNWFTVRIRTNTEENISVNEAIEQIQKTLR